MSADIDDKDLLAALCGLLGSGRADPTFVLPALRDLGKKDAPALSTADLLELLRERPEPAVASLVNHLKTRRRQEASRCHNRKRVSGGQLGEFADLLGDLPLDVPLGWLTVPEGLARLKAALADDKLVQTSAAAAALLDPLALVEKLESRPDAAGWLAPLKERIQAFTAERIRAARHSLLALPPSLPPDVDEEAAAHLLFEAFAQGQTPESRRDALDAACAWPTSRMAPLIKKMGCDDAGLRERIELLVTLRFNAPEAADWNGLSAWLNRAEERDQPARKELDSLAEQRPSELLLFWLKNRPSIPAASYEGLEALCRTPEKSAPVLEAPRPAELARTAPVAAPIPAVVPPPVDEGPSLWNEHVLPFFAENWGLLTGIAMVVVGSSLLAFYTWDKHWLVRYTVLPALLAGFTAVLARIGSWLEKRQASFKGTADMLRGAAVALLPANFMAVALMARDPQVTHKEFLLPAAALAYLVGFGGALRRWCALVEPGLESLLGGSLLLINALVLLGPLAQVFNPSGENVWFLLGAGFHAGFLLVCLAILRFVKTGLSAAAAEEKRVPWFFGVSLATTFLQVFLWVYGFMGYLPRVETYALMVIASGGLVLFSEHCARAFRKDASSYGGPSFIGYALILLGVFMGASQPQVRLAALLAAGLIWLAQAVSRRDLVHAWIGFTLLVLGAGSIGTWASFPGPWLPALALAIAAAVGAAGAPAGRLWPELAGVAARMQAAVLNAGAVLAVLVQWHYDSPPLTTAAFLLTAAALFGWRAHRDQRLAYVHAVMAILAVALPYLGFADMSGRTLHGNNVIFGLALLSVAWIFVTSRAKTPLLLNARSTVLLIYGAVALSAMLLRVAFEQGRPENLLPDQAAMSLAGPLVMAAALVMASYFSRSLLPDAIAALILVVLVPQLRQEIERYLPFIHFGSGLMSGVWAAVSAGLCFPTRRAEFLRDLHEGDRFSAEAAFPLQRRDHTLFTWPMTASAVYLAAKVDTWNLAGHLAGDGVHLKTAAALALAGLAWTLLAVYLRADRDSKGMVHLGWISFAAGLVFAYYDQAAAPVWHRALLLCGGALNALFLFYRDVVAPRRPWAQDLLAAPLRRVLRLGAILVSVLILAALWTDTGTNALWPLLCYASIELAWFGLADGDAVFGSLLFLQLWAAVLAWRVPGSASLLERISAAAAATPSLVYLLGIQALHVLLEAKPESQKKLKPLSDPLLALASLAALAAGLFGALDGVALRLLSQPQAWLLTAVVLATARAQASGPLVLNGLLLAYLAVLYQPLAALAGDQARLDFILSPWRLSLLSLLLAVLAHLGEELCKRRPEALEGRFAQPFFRLPAAPWVRGPALLAAGWAAAGHTLDPVLRNSAAQLWAPYLSAATFAVAGLSIRRAPVFALACLCLGLGNIDVVRFYLGDYLRQRGLMESHLLCLGASATLLEFSLLRLVSLREEVQVFLNRACLAAAGVVLAFLAGTYFIQPGLEAMSETRFVLSGAMAYLAGRYFQRAARRPDPGEAAYTGLWEGLYHFGVTTAIWCAVLLIPWFRHPNAAFPALSLPVLYFYLRAETAPRADLEAVARYRNTAAALSFFMLVLYAFRGAFQLVLFPGAPIGLDHYHFNAPFVLVLALVMLRLRGLGGTDWLALYGGLAMMTGSYFSLTRLPGLSPFDFPMPSAWAAVGLGHFWMLFCSRPSPLKAFLRDMAAIDEPLWQSLQSSWGLILLAATQANLFWGLSDYGANTTMVAPLLLGGASLLAHQGLLRRSNSLLVCAGVEAMAALHADFFVASYLHRDAVVWALLALWSAALLLAESRPDWLTRKAAGLIGLSLGAATLLQVFYHHPDSPEGLWAFAAAAALGALTPCEAAEPTMLGGALLAAPAWLTYFSQCRQAAPWPALTTAAALFLTGSMARWVAERYPESAPWPSPSPRLFDRTLQLLGRQGHAVNGFLLVVSFGLAALIQAEFYDRAYAPAELALILGLYGGGAAAWYHEGIRRKTLAPYFMIQFCVLGFCAVLRRQLMLTLHWWNYEYDVWASLVVSYTLAGAKSVLPLGPREARIPLLGTLLTMPIAAMLWVLVHHLGTNTVLLVIGLYSLMFSYMGKDDQESPYHLIAVGGFVSFIMIVFWTKLELRVIQAYVIPVGLGILVLLQLFRNKLAPSLRNEIRSVTLLAMLGSAAYYALMDDRYPMAFHLTLLLIGILAMSVGGFLRVRLYILLGFAGVLTDLGAILYKALLHMDRTSRMTLIGTQVLVLGAALIFGAVAYKTHQDKLNEALDSWRRRLTAWE